MAKTIILLMLLCPLYLNGQDDWAGYWKGVLSTHGNEIDMFFNLTFQDSTWSGTMDVPIQQLADFPASSVRVDETVATIMFEAIQGHYEGVLSGDNQSANGNWYQAGQTFPLDLVKSVKGQCDMRPQEPKPPYPYTSIEVVITNPQNPEIRLAGTLTVPSGVDSAKAVVLVTGSGPQNRDEELMGHKPFLVLSDYLTRRGIVVLRYDDRGVGESTGSFTTATTADFAEDARAAIAFLGGQKFIECHRIGIIGHSEGGMVASMIAAEKDVVDFMILMAGPGTGLDDLLIDQTVFLDQNAGHSEADIMKDTAYARMLYDLARNQTDDTLDTTKLRQLTRGYFDSSELIRQQFSDFERFYQSQYQTIGTRWFRYFIRFNPQDYIRQIRCPVLALNGGLDFQVPASKNLAAIKKALLEGLCKDFETRLLPGLNHLFQPAKTGHLDEYARIPTTIDPGVLEILANWIKARKS